MPKGVRSQLSFGAGLGSRCWVDTEQPHPSSPDISHCAPALLGEGLLRSPLQVEQQLMPLPSVKTPELPMTCFREGHTARIARRGPASNSHCRFAPWFGTKQPCLLGETLGAKRLPRVFRASLSSSSFSLDCQSQSPSALTCR